jgi:hypothetical protein
MPVTIGMYQSTANLWRYLGQTGLLAPACVTFVPFQLFCDSLYVCVSDLDKHSLSVCLGAAVLSETLE